MEYQQEAVLAQAEGALLSLLAEGFLRPTGELASRLARGEMRSAYSEILAGSEPAERAMELLETAESELSSCTEEEGRLKLEVEYNRLFVGPGVVAAPPYESYFASASERARGRLRGPEEREVARVYRTRGFSVPEEGGELADHVAVELAFLSQLALSEAALWREGKWQDAEQLQEEAASFRSAHIGRWIASFAALVNESARLSFYPALACLAQGAVQE